MEKKLTLKLDGSAIADARFIANARNISLSRLVENYFKKISGKPEKNGLKLTGVVAELAGVIKNHDIAYSKNDHINYLEKKYK